MRWWACAVRVALVCGCVAGSAWAQDGAELARRHFRSGVTLFQDGNFDGALAEFEASQRALPSASTLQNIALCLTRLHRYVEAIETLDRLKAEHGGALSVEDRKAVDDSMQELAKLVGTLSLQVKPASARVSVDGQWLAPEAMARPIRLSSGEHRIRAEAPMHEDLERVERIAGGESRSISIELKALAADVTVVASDREASIALDGVFVGNGSWTGVLNPGDHLLQVYKQGYTQYATRFPVRAGERLELRPALGPALADGVAAQVPGGVPLVPVRSGIEPLPKGWYGLFTATTLVPLIHPDGFKSRDAWTGGAYGLRFGYRFWQNVAFEAMFDGGKQGVGPGDYETASGTTRTTYELTSARVGGNVRLLAGGRAVRFSGVFGVGSVRHELSLGTTKAQGQDGYFVLEAGAQFNVGKVLLEAAAIGFVEGVTDVKADTTRMYTERTFVPQVGVGFRAGWGEWGRW